MPLTPRRGVGVLLLCAALAASLAVGLGVGAVALDPRTVLAALAHPHGTDAASVLVWTLRLPRVLSGTLVGAALALSGTMLQGMLRNPLGDPYLTGGSAGAALTIAVAIALGVPPPAYAALAFAAALGTTVGVASLARSGRGLSPERLILAGVAVSSLFAGLTTLVIMLAPNTTISLTILAWLGGSLAGHGWRDVGWATLYAAGGALVAASVVPALNAIRLGDVRARALGVDLDRTRWLVLIASSLLTAAAVSVSGVIGFVGLIVPHAVRALVGADTRWSVPASLPAGACMVVLADTVARTAAPPIELPLGVLLSVVGVPVFVMIAFRRASA
ncbi:MAG: iron ABC transporter permease [Candidatus Eremiobacteraeota bacterium]|nr:iron ABC transporter permease [Candidatus Eremiobacteraeota bacterium]MBV9407363.1 iron ABC transporter permease [Candidatus Eremiobacteraeota bacterium]